MSKEHEIRMGEAAVVAEDMLRKALQYLHPESKMVRIKNMNLKLKGFNAHARVIQLYAKVLNPELNMSSEVEANCWVVSTEHGQKADSIQLIYCGAEYAPFEFDNVRCGDGWDFTIRSCN